MELVYLWVEEYKNIHRQGFNFSSRFRCAYDHESNELTIDENDDYIENFFDNNINVTAIVGKNGSGKSSLFEALMTTVQGILNERGYIDKTIVFLIEKTFYIPNSIKPNIPLGYEYISLNSEKKIFPKIIHYDYTLNNINGHLNNIFDFSNYLSEDIYSGIEEKLIALPNKKSFKNIFQELERVEKNNLVDYIFNKNHSEVFGEFFSVREITIFVDNKPNEKSNNIKKLEENISTLYSELTQNKEKIVFAFFVKYLFLYTRMPNNNIEQFVDKTKFRDLYQELIGGNSHPKSWWNEHDKYFIRVTNGVAEDEQELVNYINMIQSTNSEVFDKINIEVDLYSDFPDGYTINFSIRIRNLELFAKKEVLQEIIYKLPKTVDIDLKDTIKDVAYSNLSTGEKDTLRVRYYLEKEIEKNSTNYLSLFDEPANTMHPDWQKEMLNYLINTFKKRKENFHFIFATHSPFLLSDIPKQNIIFLDTYKEKDKEVEKGNQKVGNCKVLKHDEVLSKKETFGANIHTLLSDSFFMSDGLMGEFAKSKINEIIEFYEIVQKKKHKLCLKKIYETRKKRFWQTQSIIGEDYLKQVIKNHLVEIEKILLEKDVAKLKEINRTKAYLESLENG